MNVCKDHFARVLTCKGVYNILKYLKVCLRITMNSSTNSRGVPRHPRTPLDLPLGKTTTLYWIYRQLQFLKYHPLPILATELEENTNYLEEINAECETPDYLLVELLHIYTVYMYVNKMSPYSTVITQ